VLQFIDGDGSSDPVMGSLPMSEVISTDNRSEVYALVRLPFSRHAVTDMITVVTKIRLQLQYSARKQTYSEFKQFATAELAKGGGKMFRYIDPKEHLQIDSTKFRSFSLDPCMHLKSEVQNWAKHWSPLTQTQHEVDEQIATQLSMIRKFVLQNEGRRQPVTDVGQYRATIKGYNKPSYGTDLWLCKDLSMLPDPLLEPIVEAIDFGIF
jgi:hypothetical protein